MSSGESGRRPRRTVRNDFTVAHNKKLYQVEDRTNASKVTMQDQIDGSMRMIYRDKLLRFKEIIERPVRE